MPNVKKNKTKKKQPKCFGDFIVTGIISRCLMYHRFSTGKQKTKYVHFDLPKTLLLLLLFCLNFNANDYRLNTYNSGINYSTKEYLKLYIPLNCF